jgi:hypothetical protein
MKKTIILLSQNLIDLRTELEAEERRFAELNVQSEQWETKIEISPKQKYH